MGSNKKLRVGEGDGEGEGDGAGEGRMVFTKSGGRDSSQLREQFGSAWCLVDNQLWILCQQLCVPN